MRGWKDRLSFYAFRNLRDFNMAQRLRTTGTRVWLKSHRGKYLEDRKGKVGVHKHRRGWQKWIVSDAGGGKFFFTSHRGKQLEDRKGKVKVHKDKGSYQKWTVTTMSGQPACQFH